MSDNNQDSDLAKVRVPLWAFYIIFFVAAVCCWAVSLLLLLLIGGTEAVRRFVLGSTIVFGTIWFCFVLSATGIWLCKREWLETSLYDPIEDLSEEEYDALLQKERLEKEEAESSTQ